MRAKSVRAGWVREAMGWLAADRAGYPEENVREADDGTPEILAGAAIESEAVCGADGQLKPTSIELSAWQAIELPRHWDDPEREPDEHPHRQLRDTFVPDHWRCMPGWR